MKILQKPKSRNHLSAMFFDGVIATDGDYKLETYQDGEIVYDGKLYIGKETVALTEVINDEIVDNEDDVDIHVDKFFAIRYNDTILEEYVYCDYDEALIGFEDFLNNISDGN